MKEVKTEGVLPPTTSSIHSERPRDDEEGELMSPMTF